MVKLPTWAAAEVWCASRHRCPRTRSSIGHRPLGNRRGRDLVIDFANTCRIHNPLLNWITRESCGSIRLSGGSSVQPARAA
ncbi:hypothetical protein J6590_020858 [Homalodisca vitripennis]|nr:hypothetical protein J6590_020858 [Homalodisca vitripennis]